VGDHPEDYSNLSQINNSLTWSQANTYLSLTLGISSITGFLFTVLIGFEVIVVHDVITDATVKNAIA
jgi:accessory gene regulator protein AgrB